LKDKSWLRAHYVDNEFSVMKIAEMLNCCEGSVYKYIHKHNIPLRLRNYNGVRNPKWRGGKMVSRGYILILKPDHSMATKMGYVREHRLVMEDFLGRLLAPHEIVHHINGKKDDNRVENLKLIESCGKHFVQEHLVERDSLGRFRRAR